MCDFFDFIGTFSGGIIAFFAIWIIKTKNTWQDFVLRAVLVFVVSKPLADLVQHFFGFGEKFEDVSQAIGVFSTWMILNIFRCFLNRKCLEKIVGATSKLIEVSKWGKKQ